MKLIPIVHLLIGPHRARRGWHAALSMSQSGAKSRARSAYRPRLGDSLETRLALSTASVAMVDATTADSKGVTIDYRVTSSGGDPGQALTFGVYRSADAAFDAGDVAVAGGVQATKDDAGVPAAAEGTHRLTISLPGGLPIDVAHPYVLVVADPGGAGATVDPARTASFRKYTIGVVTHGGIQNQSWKNGPPWQLEIASSMRAQGYDAVIPYNWVQESNHPGAAVKQGPRLANLVLRAAAGFDSSDPVDLHFIGHSEGAVINTVAMARLEAQMTPQIAAGYVEDTLLDPHAANNETPGRDFSASSTLLGGIADVYIRNYQADAKDPQVFIPSMVDDAQVFYQHTSANHANAMLYNLWGQVPVARAGAETHYYNLTAMGTTHSGDKGVQFWYKNFIVPTLGKQAPLVRQLRLDGALATPYTIEPIATGATRTDRTISEGRATFSGTATPGASVRLYVGPKADPSTIVLAGRATADTAGHWSVTTGPLSSGRFRAVAMSHSRDLQTRRGLAVVPMATLGTFRVDAGLG